MTYTSRSPHLPLRRATSTSTHLPTWVVYHDARRVTEFWWWRARPVPARIVVEMTDSDTAPRSWNDYLDEAERNRDAGLSLGLVRTVDQMPGGVRLRNYGHRRFVLAFDPETDDDGLLHAVLLLLRGQAALALGRGPAENLRTAEGKLNEAVRCLERLAEVQKTAGSIRKGADKIDTDCAWMQTAVNRLLAEAGAALGTAADATDAAA